MSKPDFPGQHDYSLLGDDHVRAYRDSGGEVGYIWNGAPTLLLTTTGRRSGRPRTIPIIFGRDGSDYLLVASRGGAPEHPHWYLNLRARPDAEIQVRSETMRVTARTAAEDEKPRLWQIMTGIWPNYDVYQARTDRIIPVVVLSPR
ncbi:nitroreductase family deazaflavin-dependent oxidoreductase [Spirillospora sp. CA-255316]